MMLGKEKCKILKEIRQKIAEENNIEYITSECKNAGNCKGTCPKCEEEIQQLERELNNRKRAGKTVAIVGIALGVTIGAVGCKAIATMMEDSGYDELQGEAVPAPLEGDVAAPEETPNNVNECTVEPTIEIESQDEE